MHWIIIPYRGPDGAKSRLAEALDDRRRRAMSMAMFEHVLAMATAAAGPHRVLVATTSAKAAEAAQQRGAVALREQEGSLDQALNNARVALLLFGATHATVLPADLPDLGVADVASMLSVAPGGISISSDRHGTGTNALTVPLGVDFRFAFGPGSFAAHCREARRLGLDIEKQDRPGLAADLDTSDDLALLPDGHWLHAIIARPHAA